MFYLNRDDVLDEVQTLRRYSMNDEEKKAFCLAYKKVREIPTADVVGVKHGEWEVCSDEYEICASEFVCSVCKESFCSSELTDEQMLQMMKFCPNCGAKMDGYVVKNNG